MINYLKNFFGHLKTVIVHKWWVFYYCCIFGIPFRGIVHDLSKFSPTEFFESIKYYTGTRSPIDACKEANGVSYAWMHHKGRNKHHYEYWQDNFDKGGEPVLMPYKYSVEMLCDYLGAGKAYMKDKFDIQCEIIWWENKNKNPIAMHPINKRFITNMLRFILFKCSKNGKVDLTKRYMLRKQAPYQYKLLTEKRGCDE